jgi:hypothetical protein
VPAISNVHTSTTAGGVDAATFSEISPYNVVYVMFDTPKAATTVAAVVDGITMTCGTYQPASPRYTCQTRALTISDGSGTQTIAIAATDEVGNTSQASASVVFDFTSPTLTPTVAPNPANASSSPVLTIASSKPLTGASVDSTDRVSGSGVLTAGAVTGGGTSWSAALTGAGANGTFNIHVSGTDALGHASTGSISFVIDSVVPTITNVRTSTTANGPAVTTFSEVSPFNVVYVMFDTAKAAATVAAVVDGITMSCGSYQSGSPSYTCQTRSLQIGDGSGTQTVSLTATDEVGNTSQSGASVVFDFTAPTLTPTAAPNPANASSSPVLTIASSKPLTTAAVDSVTRASGAGTVTAGAVTGSGTSWSAALSGAGANGTFTVNVSGKDTLGHTSTGSTSFVIDAVTPVISNIRTSTTAGGGSVTTFSEVNPYNVVYVMFDTPKAAASVAAVVDGITMTCGTYQATSPSYTCNSRSLQTSDGSGTQTVALTATDEAGNTSQGSVPVVFDFTAPTLTPTIAPNPANATSSPALTIASSKPLSSASVVSVVRASGSGTVTAGTVTGNGTSWSTTLTGPGANGSFTVNVSGTDALGHTSTSSVLFSIDSVVPAISNIRTSTTAGGASVTTFSEVSPYNVVYVLFDTPKAATTVSAVVDGITMTCGSYQATSPSYTCHSRSLLVSDGSGTQTIALTATDEAGNTAQNSASVVFDFTTPTLTPTAAPNPSNASSSPVLTIASSKPLTIAAVTSVVLASGTGTVTFDTATGSGTSWSAGLHGAGASGSFTVRSERHDVQRGEPEQRGLRHVRHAEGSYDCLRRGGQHHDDVRELSGDVAQLHVPHAEPARLGRLRDADHRHRRDR